MEKPSLCPSLAEIDLMKEVGRLLIHIYLECSAYHKYVIICKYIVSVSQKNSRLELIRGGVGG